MLAAPAFHPWAEPTSDEFKNDAPLGVPGGNLAGAASAGVLNREVEGGGPGLVQQAGIASRIEHPNVVHMVDVGECSGVPYLVMEMLHGRDLDSVLGERGPLPIAEALDWFGLRFAEDKQPTKAWQLVVRADASAQQKSRLQKWLGQPDS